MHGHNKNRRVAIWVLEIEKYHMLQDLADTKREE